MNIRIKRVYDSPHEDDGKRILVDRLWPRGLSKEKAGLDEWIKEIGPSNELRKWFGHRDDRWDQFRVRYLEELERRREEMKRLESLCARNTVTLLFAARDTEHNNAVVVREWLLRDRPDPMVR